MKTDKYFIVHHDKVFGTKYLVLHLPIEELGYHWTSKMAFQDLAKENPNSYRYQVLLESKQQAVQVLHDLNITEKCKIVKFNHNNKKDRTCTTSTNIIKEYGEKYGIPQVTNGYGEVKRTCESRIIFGNGWMASIADLSHRSERKAKYSVACANYDGYFDWNILTKFGANEEGVIECNTELEVIIACEYIRRL